MLSLCSLDPLQSPFYQMLNTQGIFRPDLLNKLLAMWIISAQLVIWFMSAWQLFVVNKRQTCDIHGQF